MQSATPPVRSVAQVRELERRAIADHGLTSAVLMARAGRAAFQTIKTHWPHCRRLVVVGGTGSNGGDGWVLAQVAVAAGWHVSAFLLGEAASIKGEARLALDAAQREGVVIMPSAACTAATLGSADVIVDALLGIGLTGAPRAAHTAVIRMINRAQAPVLSLDVPSGLNADTGQAAGSAVVATVTQTFIALKGGLLTGQARAYCGDLHCATLGVPAVLYQSVGQLSDDPSLHGAAHVLSLACEKIDGLSPRSPTAHKGTAGHMLVIGGDEGLGGAGILAAEAGLRAGAGLVSLACHAHTVTAALARRPEIMARSVATEGALAPLLAAADVIAIGPGLGQDVWGQMCFRLALGAAKPAVIDADGLNLLAAYSHTASPLPVLPANSVITPHPGEAARLLGVSTAQIEQNRFAAVRALVVRYRCTVVLKGAGTLVASPSDAGVDDIGICTAGNPGMASGGMGDVLTGVIAALMAQEISADRAASLGVCLHAEAADMAAVDGQRGLLASDLLPIIRRLME